MVQRSLLDFGQITIRSISLPQARPSMWDSLSDLLTT